MGLWSKRTSGESASTTPTGQQRRAKAVRKASRDGEQAFTRREQARDRAAYGQAPAPRAWWRSS